MRGNRSELAAARKSPRCKSPGVLRGCKHPLRRFQAHPWQSTLDSWVHLKPRWPPIRDPFQEQVLDPDDLTGKLGTVKRLPLIILSCYQQLHRKLKSLSNNCTSIQSVCLQREFSLRCPYQLFGEKQPRSSEIPIPIKFYLSFIFGQLLLMFP